MKSTVTYLLQAVLLLMAACAPKEAFYFSRTTGSFQSAPKGVVSASDNTPLPASLPAAAAPDEALPLTATSGPAIPVPDAGQLIRGAATGSVAALPEQQTVAHPPLRFENIGNTVVAEKQEKPPKGRKKAMVGSVETGFALSLFGVISIALVLITPYLLYFAGLLTLLGLIFSIIGLLKIRKNKTKLRGKVRAIAGIILGTIGTAIVILLLNNNF